MDIALVVTAFSFAAAFLFFLKAVPGLSGLLRRLAVPRETSGAGDRETRKNFYSFFVLRPLLRRPACYSARLPLEEYRRGIKTRFEQAGFPEDVRADEFIAFKALTALALLFLGLVVLRLNPALGIVLFGTGFFLPDFQLKGVAEKRARRIFRELPYVLDLLSLSVNAGLDFGAALAQVADDRVAPVLSGELKSMLQEIQLGKPRADALKSMARRLNHQEVSTFVSALVQADRLGVGLAEALERQAAQMRVKRFQMAEKMAAEAPIKMLFPLIIFIFPGVFIVLLGPVLMRMAAGLF